MILGNRLIEELKKQHQQVHDEADRGVPFPFPATIATTTTPAQIKKRAEARAQSDVGG
jgi:hypothetical protein